MALEWSEDLSIGIDPIDRQHQEIFSKYDEFRNACKAGKGQESLTDMLDFLGRYVESHFRMEEKLMAQSDYPGKQAHIKEHQELTGKLHAFQRQLSEQGPSISLLAGFNRSFLDWLVDHIRKTDMNMGHYLRQERECL